MYKSAEKGQKLPSLRAGDPAGPKLGQIGGFTLTELMVVMIVLGILATIGVNLIGTREKAYLAVMQADLNRIAMEQAPHAIDNYRYANNISDLPFAPSEGVTVELLGEGAGFAARTTHRGLPGARCAIFMGTVSSTYSPAIESGLVACDGN